MAKIKNTINYFTKNEIILWLISIILITASFCIFDRSNYMILFASLIGVTSLIFYAKGNPLGQILMIIFSILYGFISFKYTYYGETITYLAMTLPMAVFSLISWLKHPYKGKKSEVEINTISKKDILVMLIATTLITIAFYFILKHFNTANIIPSTISVATSFAAAYLTFKRSHFYALGYALNDIILLVLWSLASITDIRYISVVVCFVAFLFNDIYGFISWKRMKKRQSNDN